MKFKDSITQILFLLIFTATFNGISQQNRVSGILQDSISKQSIEFAEVKLLNKADSTIISGAISDFEGKFDIKTTISGSFFLVISSFDFETKIISPINLTSENQNLELGAIYLKKPVANKLEAVEIVVKKEAFQIGLDKKIYNVGEDISTRGGSANDVLVKVPSIDVDQDGNISLRGDGKVTILIDGRPSSMSGGNGKSLLDGIPATSIERIEVINNPSAKYDPDGTSGIINIVLKKNKMRGTNVMLTTTIGSSYFYNGSATASVRNSKLNVYANYSYKNSVGYRNQWGTLKRITDEVVSSKLIQDRKGTDTNISHTLKFGIDFYLKNNNLIGFTVTGNTGNRARTGNVVNKLYTGEDDLLQVWERGSYDPTKNNNIDISMIHVHNFKNNKGVLESSVTQSIGQAGNDGFYDEKYLNLDETLSDKSFKNQRLFNDETNNVLTYQSDYSKTIDVKKIRFESGIKAIVKDLGVNTFSETMDTISKLFYSDTLANFKYSYKEQIYSAYINLGQEKGRFKYQGGLRFEQAYQLPNLISTNEKFTNIYFNIYPSGIIRYKSKENSEWSLSYSRRVNRASSEDLNPFTSYADPYNLRKGNPALKPEFINSFEFGNSKEFTKFTMMTNIYYRITNDVMQRVKIFNSDNSATVTFANIDQSHSGGLEMVFNYKPYKWWRNTISFNASMIQFVDDTKEFNYNNTGFNFTSKVVSSVEYWNKTMVSQINIQYNAPQTTAQGIVQRRGAIEISTEKSFLKNKWSIGLKVSDILDRQGFSLKIRQPSIEQDTEFKWLTRRIYGTITYKFGKVEMLNKPKGVQESSGGGMDY